MVQMVSRDVCSGHPCTCRVFLFFVTLSDSLACCSVCLTKLWCSLIFKEIASLFFFPPLRFKKNLCLAAPCLMCGM